VSSRCLNRILNGTKFGARVTGGSRKWKDDGRDGTDAGAGTHIMAHVGGSVQVGGFSNLVSVIVNFYLFPM